MSKVETRIAYTGPALEDGVMDVRELAPALLALGEVCDSAHEVLTGQKKRVSVRVRGFETGSFEVAVEVVELWERLTHVLTGSDYLTAKELVALLLGAGGLITYIKKRRGRKVEKTVATGNDQVTVTFDDGESLVARKEVEQLYNAPIVRRAFKKVVAPLESEGVEGLEIRDPKNRDKVVENISREDAPYYAEIPDHGEVAENEIELLLQPVTVQLEGDRQWVFRRGTDETLRARIADKEFVRKMKTGEISFRRGDVIRARVRERQWEQDGDLKIKSEIVKVLEHREARGKPPPAADGDQSAAG